MGAQEETRKCLDLNLTLEGHVAHHVNIFPYFIHCYGLQGAPPPQNSYVEAPTPMPQNVTVFGDRAFLLKGWLS